MSRRDVTAAIVGQPLDGDRQAIDQLESTLDGCEHEITNVLAAEAARGGEEAHGVAITAIEREGAPHRTRSPLSQPNSKLSEH